MENLEKGKRYDGMILGLLNIAVTIISIIVTIVSIVRADKEE